MTYRVPNPSSGWASLLTDTHPSQPTTPVGKLGGDCARRCMNTYAGTHGRASGRMVVEGWAAAVAARKREALPGAATGV